eukprot:GDKI01014321.1.p1 GENE.GDKI01014321.1~~GDKI01014321.1.p1  ORF type:complete len:181 (-),score=49.64 GDKI01014321.1:55-525(-)
MAQPLAIKRLQFEFKKLQQENPPNISAGPEGDDLFKWHAVIVGPAGTPYEGGTFKCELEFPKDFPFKPPRVRVLTKIYHCNIDPDASGNDTNVCMDLLRDQWGPSVSVATLLSGLCSLLIEPHPDSPLVGDIANLFKSDRAKHDKTAREWTQKYAK